ncbi:MAG: type II toxin-antitoxin system RelE/ParE family toxin [Ruminiclostridium sp.]
MKQKAVNYLYRGFLDSLSIKMRTKALSEINLLKEFGTQLREPYSKLLKDGIFELRIKFAGDITRIFYFFYVGNKIILTNGFLKKSQKTPPGEIEKALKFKADYERRHRHDKL